MNEKKFIQTMGAIDDDLLVEAYSPIKKKSYRYFVPPVLVACLCLAIGLGIWMKGMNLNHSTLIVSEDYNLRLELPEHSSNISHQILKDDPDMPVLEANFTLDEKDYLCRMAKADRSVDLSANGEAIVCTMNWKTTKLDFHYEEQEDDFFWVSWYDAESGTQWALACKDSVSLLTTAEVLVQKMGYSMAVAPEGASEIAYRAVQYENLTIGETSFLKGDVQYTYRMAATGRIEEYFMDISEQPLTGKERLTNVRWCPARITIDANGQGKILWIDVVPGLLYSLTMDSNATEESLLEMAFLLYEPAQEPGTNK